MAKLTRVPAKVFAVSTGDYVEIKWVTPTWTINPINCSPQAILLIDL